MTYGSLDSREEWRLLACSVLREFSRSKFGPFLGEDVLEHLHRNGSGFDCVVDWLNPSEHYIIALTED